MVLVVEPGRHLVTVIVLGAVDAHGEVAAVALADREVGRADDRRRSAAELLPVLTSPVVDTEAVLVTEGAAAEGDTHGERDLAGSAGGQGARIGAGDGLAAAEQDHPVPIPETKLSPLGRVSVTVMPAVVGPCRSW